MKTFLTGIFGSLIVLLFSASHAQADRYWNDRISIENRSSSDLLIYRSPFSTLPKPVRRLRPGEEFSTRTGRDDQWIASTPVWYRIVGSIKLADAGWSRRLVIRNSDVERIGRRPQTTKFVNRSRVPVKVRIVVDGKELDRLWIGVGESTQTIAFEGQPWVFRAQSNGRFIQRSVTPGYPSTINILPRGFGGGGSMRPPGSQYPPPQPPPAARKVNVRFFNDTSQAVYIYKMKDGAWKYTKRIYAGREFRLEFEVGQPISIRNPWSGDEIERLRAPSRDTSWRISGQGGYRPGRPR